MFISKSTFVFVWVMVIFLGVLLSAPLHAQGYTFKKLVVGGPASDFTSGEPMAMSAHGGLVLFLAKQRNGVTGLFLNVGGETTKVIDDTAELNNILAAAVNSRGRVVVSGLTDDRNTVILMVDAGKVQTLFKSADPVDVGASVHVAPRINDLGVAAYTLRPHPISGAHGGAKVILADGSNTFVVADQATNFATATTVMSPDINNRNHVSFIATNFSGGGGLYRLQDDGFALLVPNSQFNERFLATVANPSMNDNGWVAFEAMELTLGMSIFLHRPSQPAVELVAAQRGTGSSPFNSVSRPMVNNAGMVAFVGQSGATSSAIYSWVGGAPRKVIGDGDPLFGSTAGYINAPQRGRYLDEGGAIMFSYILQNGEAGIALATPPPTLSNGTLANAATFVSGGLVPGSWAQVKGMGLAESSRLWSEADFAGLGGNLPTKLDGVEVKVNGRNAAVYFISPTQITFQVPDVPAGMASVAVVRNGVASAPLSAQIVERAPGIFPIVVGGKNYASGVFLDGKVTGDPTVTPAFRRAKPGDVIQLYATGLERSPAGAVPGPQTITGVSVQIGEITVPAVGAALVSVGLFQVNFVVPQAFASMAPADYPVRVQVAGVSSPLNINGAPNPDGPVVIPIEPGP